MDGYFTVAVLQHLKGSNFSSISQRKTFAAVCPFKSIISDSFITGASSRMMKSSLLLAVLSIMMSFPSCQSSCEEQEIGEPHRSELEIQKSRGLSNIPRELLKRYSDIDYDSFVGLMGRRSSGTNNLPLQKRGMHDVFVGLMGRRGSQIDESRPWRQEYPVRRAGIFFNKCKLRTRQEE